MIQKITYINHDGDEVEIDFQETPIAYRAKRINAILDKMTNPID